MDSLITALAGAVSLPIIVGILFLLYPEKVEKWWAILLRGLVVISKSLHRRQVTHDLQGRVNDFVRRLKKVMPDFHPAKLRIEWVAPDQERKAFFDRDEVVLRVFRDDPDDLNFVHGAYLYVGETLLAKAKRYTSPSQREALDLFTTGKLLEEERMGARVRFVDEYLHPKTADPKGKISRYVDDFATLDIANFYFPVLLQELGYLGEKVFGRRRDASVIIEVDELINFLRPIATRTVGDDNDLTYRGEYCKFGIVIVGKPAKLLLSIQPYVGYIEGQLLTQDVETIYLLARAENLPRLQQIYDRFASDYEWAAKNGFSGVVRYGDETRRIKQVLVVLRKRGLAMVQPAMR
ncbi:MAG: hypothetical protein ACRELD_06895 [Longimicrobiales bacterium]